MVTRPVYDLELVTLPCNEITEVAPVVHVSAVSRTMMWMEGSGVTGIHHPYWDVFTPASYNLHLLIGTVMAAVGVVAVTGNVIVIVVFLR